MALNSFYSSPALNNLKKAKKKEGIIYLDGSRILVHYAKKQPFLSTKREPFGLFVPFWEEEGVIF